MLTTNTIKKAAGATNANGLQTETNGLNFSTGTRNSKAESDLSATPALAGHTAFQLRNEGIWSTSMDAHIVQPTWRTCKLLPRIWECDISAPFISFDKGRSSKHTIQSVIAIVGLKPPNARHKNGKRHRISKRCVCQGTPISFHKIWTKQRNGR